MTTQSQLIFKRACDRRTRSYHQYKAHTRRQWNLHWQRLAGATARNEVSTAAIRQFGR